MRNIFTLLLILACPAALADDINWIVSGRLTAGYAYMDNSSHGGTLGTGTRIGNFVDGELTDRNVDDATNGIGIALGRQFGNWRVESELTWRYRSDWDLSAPSPAINTVTNLFTNFSTTSLLFSGIYEGRLGQHWTWEAGAGAGVAMKVMDGEFIERGVQTDGTDFVANDTRARLDLAWQALIGVSRRLGDHWTANLRYRYADLGELRIGPYPQRPAHLHADLSLHELVLGFDRSL